MADDMKEIAYYTNEQVEQWGKGSVARCHKTLVQAAKTLHPAAVARAALNCGLAWGAVEAPWTDTSEIADSDYFHETEAAVHAVSAMVKASTGAKQLTLAAVCVPLCASLIKTFAQQTAQAVCERTCQEAGPNIGTSTLWQAVSDAGYASRRRG